MLIRKKGFVLDINYSIITTFNLQQTWDLTNYEISYKKDKISSWRLLGKFLRTTLKKEINKNKTSDSFNIFVRSWKMENNFILGLCSFTNHKAFNLELNGIKAIIYSNGIHIYIPLVSKMSLKFVNLFLEFKEYGKINPNNPSSDRGLIPIEKEDDGVINYRNPMSSFKFKTY